MSYLTQYTLSLPSNSICLEFFTTIVIGGGPAGLAASIYAAEQRTLLLEKNDSLGKKLLIAGTGRCNITHEGAIADFLSRYGSHGRFLKHSLKAFTNKDLVAFFTDRGLSTIVDKNGKVFPSTEKSRDVLRVLQDAAISAGVEIKTGAQVESVAAIEGGFQVTTNAGLYYSKCVVIATGGRSYPTTGSSGDGYRIAQELGHTLVEPKPALTPVFVLNYSYGDLAGVSMEATPIYLYRDGRKVNEHCGDIGFTHKGLSGPGIIDFSRDMIDGDILKVNIVKSPIDLFRRELIDATSRKGAMSIQTYLKDYEIPKSLLRAVLDKCELEPAALLSNIPVAKRNKLIDLLCEHPFEIERLGSFKVAMATAGGVSLTEISPKSMESKIHSGLYFVGEVLDIDGDTGGYNIQAAFSTGVAAGRSIVKGIGAAE